MQLNIYFPGGEIFCLDNYTATKHPSSVELKTNKTYFQSLCISSIFEPGNKFTLKKVKEMGKKKKRNAKDNDIQYTPNTQHNVGTVVSTLDI